MPTVKIETNIAKPIMAQTIYRLTDRQIEALRAGANGNAAAMRGSRMGGAKHRMIDRLVEMRLITETYPRRTTPAGDAVLAALAPKS